MDLGSLFHKIQSDTTKTFNLLRNRIEIKSSFVTTATGVRMIQQGPPQWRPPKIGIRKSKKKTNHQKSLGFANQKKKERSNHCWRRPNNSSRWVQWHNAQAATNASTAVGAYIVEASNSGIRKSRRHLNSKKKESCSIHSRTHAAQPATTLCFDPVGFFLVFLRLGHDTSIALGTRPRDDGIKRIRVWKPGPCCTGA